MAGAAAPGRSGRDKAEPVREAQVIETKSLQSVRLLARRATGAGAVLLACVLPAQVLAQVLAQGAPPASRPATAPPAGSAAPMREGRAPELAGELAAIPHVDADVVTLAYDRGAVSHPLDGTGHVVATPGARTRACTWASRKWHARAPEGAVLFRSVVDARGASDRDAIELARIELEPLLDIRGRPRLTRIRRRRAALPVPSVGHGERRARIAAHTQALDGLCLAGSAAGGVGVPDCLASGAAAVATLLGPARSLEAAPPGP